MNRCALVFVLCGMVLFGLVIITPSAASQDASPCDSEVLKQAVQEDTGYKLRDSRCEGLYRRQVSTSAPLSLRSFMLAAPSSGDLPPVLKVAWTPSTASQINLHAQALKARTYFQMDTHADGRSGTYDWPTNVLKSIPLSATEIGVTASFTEGGQRVYLPVTFANAQGGDGSINVALWPEQRFVRVHRTVITQRGGNTVTIAARAELGEGVYPQQRPIRFSVMSRIRPV